MNLKATLGILLIAATFSAYAQVPPADTVIIPLAKTSRIIFTIQDRNDLEVLRHYDFQGLFDDLLQRLAEADTLRKDTTENDIVVHREAEEDWNTERNDDNENDDNDDMDNEEDDEYKWEESRRGKIGQTWQSTNVDFGTNNFLARENQFPDGSELYAVRPWGSWYLGVNSVQRTRLARNVFVEWGLGVSSYTFKFQQDNILIQKDELGVEFLADTREVDFIKSKLSATFINASLVPVLDFGDHSRKRRMWDGHGSEFRIGFGPYVGYRIASRSKLVYKEDGNRERDKNRDSFYLNNLRYGFRLQLGLRSTDLFLNYDMNELFAKNKGPELNALSFGIIF
ncbi:MAG: hypothetical protein ABIR06_17045 [Cyclobacteriaceae bacterium]